MPMPPTRRRRTSGWSTWRAASGARPPRPSVARSRGVARTPHPPHKPSLVPLRCYDPLSCTERRKDLPYLTSSKFPNGDPRWPVVVHMTGIFSVNPERNPMAGANLVQIGYCSSDAWVGNVAAKDATTLAQTKNVAGTDGWAFKGQRIIEATLATLSAHFAFGAMPRTRLLFGGCSAGARGAMFNLDFVPAMVPPGVQVRGFLDSPLWVDVEPLEPNVVSLETQTRSTFELVNATARLGDACALTFPGDEGWKCLYGAYRIPFVTTPFLMSASQFDKYQLPYNEGAMPPYNTTQLAYAQSFQTAVRTVVEALPNAGQSGSAVYSSACFQHCTSNLETFWGVRVGSLNLKDYLALWFFGADQPAGEEAATEDAGLPPSVPAQHIENCYWFACGQCHNRSAPVLAPPGYAMPPAPGTRAHAKRLSSGHVVVGLTLLLSVVGAALYVGRPNKRRLTAPAPPRAVRTTEEQVALLHKTVGPPAGVKRSAAPAGVSKVAPFKPADDL